jgi:hypothetical protein
MLRVPRHQESVTLRDTISISHRPLTQLDSNRDLGELFENGSNLFNLSC